MSLLSLIQASVCGLIALRVFLFQRRGQNYRPTIAFLAYMIVVTSAAVTICVLFDLCKQAYWGTLVLLIEFLCALCFSHGNISKLYHKKSSSHMQYKPCKFPSPLTCASTTRKNQVNPLSTKHRLQQAQ